MNNKTTRIASILAATLLGCGGATSQDGAVGSAEAALTATTSTKSWTVGNDTYPNLNGGPLLAGATAEVDYANTELGTTDVYLHYGFNGWQAIGEVRMSGVGGGGITPYAYAVIAVPSWATRLDYAVYAVRADGSRVWDNNRGRDFHADVFTAVADAVASGADLQITYVGKLSPAKVHWGKSGWQGVTDTAMVKDATRTIAGGYARWTATLPSAAASWVDYCFTNGSGGWDNNATRNWVYAPGTAHLSIYPSNLGSFYQPNLEGAPVTAWRNGQYAGTFTLASHHSGEYFYADGSGPMGDWKFVLDTIVGGTRYTAEATARITTASPSVYFEVKQAAWGQ